MTTLWFYLHLYFGYQDEASPIGVLNIVLNQEEINRIVQSEIEKIVKTAQIYI